MGHDVGDAAAASRAVRPGRDDGNDVEEAATTHGSKHDQLQHSDQRLHEGQKVAASPENDVDGAAPLGEELWSWWKQANGAAGVGDDVGDATAAAALGTKH